MVKEVPGFFRFVLIRWTVFFIKNEQEVFARFFLCELIFAL
jgi:hypothetical protein